MSIAIGNITKSDDIFKLRQEMKLIIRSFLENLSWFSFHIRNAIAKADSPKNKGLPIVLH